MPRNKIIEEFIVHKEGIIIGGLVGAAAAYWVISQGVDLNAITTAGKALLDNMMTRSAPLEIATAKIYLGFITIGAAIGYLCDKIIIGR